MASRRSSAAAAHEERRIRAYASILQAGLHRANMQCHIVTHVAVRPNDKSSRSSSSSLGASSLSYTLSSKITWQVLHEQNTVNECWVPSGSGRKSGGAHANTPTSYVGVNY